jgi:ABC-type lipoprotein export system ATPase subunit
MVPFSLFGRDQETQDAVERLRQHPFLAAVGPSGSGKSSLVHAGVLRALRRTPRFGAGQWEIKTMRP